MLAGCGGGVPAAQNPGVQEAGRLPQPGGSGAQNQPGSVTPDQAGKIVTSRFGGQVISVEPDQEIEHD